MRLRTQILLLLCVFGLAPLAAVVILNLPPVARQLTALYNKAHVQALRAEFADLEQHLASRRETLRMLAGLPEPGFFLTTGANGAPPHLDEARAQYTEWINRMLRDQHDVATILFLDASGTVPFWLERGTGGGALEPTPVAPATPPDHLVEATRAALPGLVLTSALIFDEQVTDAGRPFMSLWITSRLPPTPGATDPSARALVALALDVGGLVRAHPDTLWVRHDGHIVTPPGEAEPANVFIDQPRLESLFAQRQIALAPDAGGTERLWIPLFVTEQGDPVWVGRRVDPSPIADFMQGIVLRIAAVTLALIVLLVYAARFLALRGERIGRELREGLARALEHGEAVRFEKRGPEDLIRFAGELSRLAENHAEQRRALEHHAQALETSNRYKSQFLANMSHELRTPLNSILLLSRLLAANDEKNLSADQRRHAQVIHQAGKDLLNLIDHLLDLARIEARMVTVHLKRIDLAALLRDVADLIMPLCAEKALTLDLVLDDGAPGTIVSDEEKLRQILKNLLANAVKFTARGGITLTLGHPAPGSGVALPVALSVRDTGPGIPEQAHAAIFEPFRQLDAGANRRHGGAGLGLAISRELAGLLGGHITLDSAVGRGSTFTLHLPLEASAEREPPPPGVTVNRELLESAESAPPASAPAGISLSGRRILLAGGELPRLVERTLRLQRSGAQVVAAIDAAETRAALHAGGPFDLVLVDGAFDAETQELANPAPVIAIDTSVSIEKLAAQHLAES